MLVTLAPIHPRPQLPGFSTERDIFGDCQVREKRRLLVNHRYSELPRQMRVKPFDSFPSEPNFTRIGVYRTAQDLNQCGFPGAVLAYKRVYLACVEVERNVVQRTHSAVSFLDPNRLQDWIHRRNASGRPPSTGMT